MLDQSNQSQGNNAEVESYTKEIPSSLSFTKAGEDVVEVSDALTVDEKESGVAIEGNLITISQPNTTLYLNAEIPAETEAYFICSNMDYEPLEKDIDSISVSYTHLRDLFRRIAKSWSCRICLVNCLRRRPDHLKEEFQ